MTRPPIYPPGAGPDEEALDELGDDAIVAQQAVHAPQPRAVVEMDSRTIVVADETPVLDPSEVMETRQLPQYGAAHDVTTAARRAASRAPTMVLRRSPIATRPKKKRNWVVIGIWIAAGVVAFGFGGILAALTARAGNDEAASASPVVAEPPLAPPPAAQPAATTAPAAEPVVAEPVEAVTAQELPVEPAPAPKSEPRKKPRLSSTAAKPVTTSAPVKREPAKGEIPEGI